MKLLQITSPAQFKHYAAAMGEPALEVALPEPTPIDPARVVEVGRRYDIEFLPPPEQ